MQLKIENITLRRGSKLLIKDLSFQLKRGQSLILSGPNGVGKTTLIRTIAGFLQPENGQISFQPTDQNKLNSSDEDLSFSEKIHYIGHKNGIRNSLTVLENLEFWAEFYGEDNPIKTVASDFQIKSLLNIPAGYLSAGQKRRLSLSRLSLAQRPLWLLDEPTVSLDKKSVELVADICSSHVEQGGLLIAATHIPLKIKASEEINLKPIIEQNWEPLI